MAIHFGSIAPNPIVYQTEPHRKEVITGFKQPGSHSVQMVGARFYPEHNGHEMIEASIAPSGFSYLQRPNLDTVRLSSAKQRRAGQVRYINVQGQSESYTFELDQNNQVGAVFDLSDKLHQFSLPNPLPQRIRDEIEDTYKLMEQVRDISPNAFTAMA